MSISGEIAVNGGLKRGLDAVIAMAFSHGSADKDQNDDETRLLGGFFNHLLLKSIAGGGFERRLVSIPSTFKVWGLYIYLREKL
jgi:hypothetical protein